jgi:DNA-directed RNA polymerase specialized sigma24 family protein
MTDLKFIDDLIGHPEFMRQAEKICQGIAGPERYEDLLQEACLRVLESVSELNPNTIRNEREFFGWFSLLARRVHLSRSWSKAAVSSCTQEDAGWPDALADIPADEMDQFIDHADACPYHTRLLDAEDEKLRAIFRLARGLDSHGRLLERDELHASIIDHKRRLQNWREAAFKNGKLFGHMALFNGGKEIASCGKFYDFSIHVSRNELDPSAGLQIRGVPTNNMNEDVLLGFYPLAGVNHEGAEKILELDNGYTVGLAVKQVGETTFEIHFRCVATRTPEAEGTSDDSADGIVLEINADECPESSSRDFATPPPFPVDMPVSPGWWPLSTRKQAAVTVALVVLVAVSGFLIGKNSGRIPAEDWSVVQAKESQPTAFPSIKKSQGIDEELNSPSVQAPPSRNLDQGASANRSRGGAVKAPEAEPRINGEHEIISTLDSLHELKSFTAQLSDGKSEIQDAPQVVSGQSVVSNLTSNYKVDDGRSSTQLMSYDELRYSANKSGWRDSSASLQKASYEDQPRSADISVLHTATNEAIITSISYALKLQHFRVERIANQAPTTARFVVTWVARESAWRDRSPVVKLNAYVYRNGEKNSVYERSYEVAGDNLNEAYDNAVEMIIKPVIDWIRDSEKFSSSPNGNGSTDQLRTDAPKDQLIGRRRNVDVIQPSRRERRAVQFQAGDSMDDRPPQTEETEEN